MDIPQGDTAMVGGEGHTATVKHEGRGFLQWLRRRDMLEWVHQLLTLHLRIVSELTYTPNI